MLISHALSVSPASPGAAPTGRAAAARKFEGLIMAEMLSAMRAAKLDDGLFDNGSDDNWRRMGDQLLAETLAARAPLGVAKTLETAQ